MRWGNLCDARERPLTGSSQVPCRIAVRLLSALQVDQATQQYFPILQ